jgi:hypothetical protein
VLSRSQRLGALGYIWSPTERHTSCPVCEAPSTIFRDYTIDRYGFLVDVGSCTTCTHHWLLGYLTEERARLFYADGWYRKLVDAHHGTTTTPHALRDVQREYAKGLVRTLRDFTGRRRLSRLVDVGGAPGTIANIVGKAFRVDSVSMIDPAAPDAASEDDVFEDLDLVLLCQTIDHVIDPYALLSKVHTWLHFDGLLWLDIVDFDQRGEVKIDHPQMFSDASARQLLDRAGFEILGTHDGLTPEHRGYIAKATL